MAPHISCVRLENKCRVPRVRAPHRKVLACGVEISSTAAEDLGKHNVRIGGDSPEMPIPSTDSVPPNNHPSANHTTECSSMRTARPAAWPPHPFFELRAHPFDMLPSGLIFLDGDGPADPLVARERRYVFPSHQCLRVGRERLSKISRKVMYDSSGDSNGCHKVISQAKGLSI